MLRTRVHFLKLWWGSQTQRRRSKALAHGVTTSWKMRSAAVSLASLERRHGWRCTITAKLPGVLGRPCPGPPSPLCPRFRNSALLQSSIQESVALSQALAGPFGSLKPLVGNSL
jgi:hypothetical protein